MNNFKYQKKNKPSEEVMNSFKDFDKVLDQHKTISSAYKSIWKYVFIATGAAGISISAFFLYTKPTENNLSNSTPEITIREQVKVGTPEDQKPPLQDEPIKVVRESNVAQNEIKINTKKNEKPIVLKESKTVSIIDSTPLKEDAQIETWYTLNEKSKIETIQLPTLFVSNEAWPVKIDKTTLVKTPKMMALYQGINREIPIVNGTAYITTEDATEKPIGHKLKGNVFPPGLIREIHKSSEASILLLKDIEFFIPGRGRINAGDLKIKIHQDKQYLKRF